MLPPMQRPANAPGNRAARRNPLPKPRPRRPPRPAPRRVARATKVTTRLFYVVWASLVDMARVTLIDRGERFGRLSVIGRGTNSATGKARYSCVCDCGNVTLVLVSNLLRGRTKSCGCIRIEMAIKTGHNNKTHGYRWTITYSSWKSVIERCKKGHKSSKFYFDRGIKVCDAWLKFENFLADMGERPSKNHQLDRIDNDQSYHPLNCRWSTVKEQQRNRRSNRVENVFG